MSTARACNQDAEDWVNELKNQGITKFSFSDLPAELKVRTLLHKASTLQLIERVGKGRYYTAIWAVR